jgi:hypothetical protein
MHPSLILIEPPSFHFYNDEFFNANSPLNRDDCLRPNIILRDALATVGIEVHTSDCWGDLKGQYEPGSVHYWSLGGPASVALRFDPAVKKAGCYLMEPPVVKPGDYRLIPQLSVAFDRVYVHEGIRAAQAQANPSLTNLRPFTWPMTYPDNPPTKTSGRLNRVAMICGGHTRFRPADPGNGYALRYRALVDPEIRGYVDLYGHGWGINKRDMLHPLSILRKLQVRRLHAPRPVTSKLEVLARYNFALCAENQAIEGYVTEKVVDCLLAGTIPIYWGASDLRDYVPENCFIGVTNGDYARSIVEALTMSEAEVMNFQSRITGFVRSEVTASFPKSYRELLNAYAT